MDAEAAPEPRAAGPRAGVRGRAAGLWRHVSLRARPGGVLGAGRGRRPDAALSEKRAPCRPRALSVAGRVSPAGLEAPRVRAPARRHRPVAAPEAFPGVSG